MTHLPRSRALYTVIGFMPLLTAMITLSRGSFKRTFDRPGDLGREFAVQAAGDHLEGRPEGNRRSMGIFPSAPGLRSST
ncbi:hypothetical protein [Mangrovihabitans endophyticus]|uniref:hypothetical protein n=1 Tax=Mangrovihabitans endophyticus TaxID=1751298 RepID=UPI00166A89B3|nr:hypothetical protein [Mangrovihabitans endophyticus]